MPPSPSHKKFTVQPQQEGSFVENMQQDQNQQHVVHHHHLHHYRSDQLFLSHQYKRRFAREDDNDCGGDFPSIQLPSSSSSTAHEPKHCPCENLTLSSSGASISTAPLITKKKKSKLRRLVPHSPAVHDECCKACKTYVDTFYYSHVKTFDGLDEYLSSLLNEILCIKEKHSFRHFHLANVLTTLGLHYSALSQFDEAIDSHREVIHVLRKSLVLGHFFDGSSEDHDADDLRVQELAGIGSAWGDIGIIFYRQGKYDQAVDAYEHALDVFVNRCKYGRDHPRVLAILLHYEKII